MGRWDEWQTNKMQKETKSSSVIEAMLVIAEKIRKQEKKERKKERRMAQQSHRSLVLKATNANFETPLLHRAYGLLQIGNLARGRNGRADILGVEPGSGGGAAQKFARLGRIASILHL